MNECSGKSGASMDLRGPGLVCERVSKARSIADIFEKSMPAFGGGSAGDAWRAIRAMVGSGCPIFVTAAGPLTASGQDIAYLNDFIEGTNAVASFAGTDAQVYHGVHRAIERFNEPPLFKVPIEGADLELGEKHYIRICDFAMEEKLLFDTDRFWSAVLRQPEFQKRMSGTELRHRLGKYQAAQEREVGVAEPGLLSVLHRMETPWFVGATNDGSVYLNAGKLRAAADIGLIPEFKLEVDPMRELLEAAALHLWCLKRYGKIGVIILGGGVPKNNTLQGEPFLSQILQFSEVEGFAFDVQFVSVPVIFGCLTSCKPAEGHTWGKVEKEALIERMATSHLGDYSVLMPFMVKGILEIRERYQQMYAKMGDELFARHPEARGFLRTEPLRLYRHLDEAVAELKDAIRNDPKHQQRLLETMDFPLPELQLLLG